MEARKVASKISTAIRAGRIAVVMRNIKRPWSVITLRLLRVRRGGESVVALKLGLFWTL
jgi:hypothetical protein